MERYTQPYWISMALVGLLLSLIAVCSSCVYLVRVPVDGRTVEEQQASAVRVASGCLTEEGLRLSMGSGVIIGRRWVLTAYHVIMCDGLQSVAVNTALGDTVLGTVLVGRSRRDRDIAVVELFQDVPASLVYFASPPNRGSGSCMSPGRPTATRVCGVVVARTLRYPGDVFHSISTEPGNSGAGVYDSYGRLWGIATHWRSCGGYPCGGAAASLVW